MGHSDFKSEVNVLESFCITEVLSVTIILSNIIIFWKKIKRQVCLVADVVRSVLSA